MADQEDGTPDETEYTHIQFLPHNANGVPCVIMQLSRPIDYILFDEDELLKSFKAAIEAMEDAKVAAYKD